MKQDYCAGVYAFCDAFGIGSSVDWFFAPIADCNRPHHGFKFLVFGDTNASFANATLWRAEPYGGGGVGVLCCELGLEVHDVGDDCFG